MSNMARNISSSGQESSLARWITETIGLPGMRLRLQVRGNDLRILCEGQPCPKRTDLQLRLIPALQAQDINRLIPAYQPPIYRIQLYGRLNGQPAPEWKASIHLDQLDRHLEQLKRSLQLSPELVTASRWQEKPVPQAAPSNPFVITEEEASLSVSTRNLAKRGSEIAIAQYLSEALIDLGVAVRVNAKTLPYAPAAAVRTASPEDLSQWTMKRLWVMCEAHYSPESSLISEPLTQKLRDLEVEGFRDAVIMFRVLGENSTDWMLRVDLTPPGDMLREWARWGDAEAIQRLLSQTLQPAGFQVSAATLQDATLHLVCTTQPFSIKIPDQKRIRAEIGLFLEALAPQGIRSTALYGQVKGKVDPVWVEWLDLPASVHAALAEPVMALAQTRDWGAIAFLLHRLLNPDLNQYLATGGTRIQLLPKQDLLHVMSEAYICPDKQAVCGAITRFLQPLQIPGLAGVRVYGRRSGEKHPLWQFGSDFVSRESAQIARSMPEAMPEFLSTIDYLNDLLPQDDALELPPTDIQVTLQKSRNRVHAFIQTVLTRSQLFIVAPESQVAISLPGEVSYQGTRVALVWSAIGVVLMLQANWLLGQVVRAQPKETVAQTLPIVVPAAASPSPSLPAVSPIPESTASPSPNDDVFNTSGFTQLAPATKGSISTATIDESATQTLPPLPYTPPDLKADLATAALLNNSPLPTFNSRQLDEKIQLYYQYLEKFGTPDVMVVGSSRALRGVDPIALEESLADMGYASVKVFNFGINGATAQVVDLLLQRILLPEQLPRMILWADGARALNSGAVDVTHDGIMASEAYRQLMAGTLPIPRTALAPDAPSTASRRGVINQTLTESYATIDRWFSQQLSNISGTYSERDRLKGLFKKEIGVFLPESVTEMAIEPSAQSEIQPGEPLMNGDGFLSLPLQFNPATYYQKYAKVPGAYDSDYEKFQVAGKQEMALQSLIQFAQSQKIPVVFVNLPLTNEYLDPVRSEYEQQFKQSMLSLSMGQGFTFKDLGDRWTTEHRYFSDPSHLNRYGAYAISKQLAQDPLIPWVKGRK
jgi:hypothetical protein